MSSEDRIQLAYFTRFDEFMDLMNRLAVIDTIDSDTKQGDGPWDEGAEIARKMELIVSRKACKPLTATELSHRLS